MKQTGIARLENMTNMRWLVMMVSWLSIMAAFRPLKLPDEGRYVGVAWEMLSSGSWWVPRLDGLPYFHKPPLFYWLTAGSLHMCGPGLLCTRFASLFSASLLAMTLLWFLTRHLGRKTATVTLLVLLTQPFFFASAQFANLDMLVASMITMTILFVAEAVWAIENGASYKYFLTVAYIFAALGLLAKGLIGVVIPAAVIFLWLAYTRRLFHWRYLLWLPGLALFALIGLPWFLLMEWQFKGFLHYFFIHHHFQRFAGTDFNNQQPVWFYLPALLILTLPWSFGIFKWRPQMVDALPAKAKDLFYLMVCWVVFVLLFFSMPLSKPLGYIMPVLPPFSVLLAMLLSHASTQVPVSDTSDRRILLNGMLAAFVCVCALLMVIRHEQKTASFQMAKQVRQKIAQDDQLIMLGKYQFDLPFYFQTIHPAWVVSNWDTLQRPLKDSWKKELLDAKGFDPMAARQSLMTFAGLRHTLCQPGNEQQFWVVGESDAAQVIDLVKDKAPIVRYGHHQLWHITSANVANFCKAGTQGTRVSRGIADLVCARFPACRPHALAASIA